MRNDEQVVKMDWDFNKAWVVALATSGLLAVGCGQKGPLYLPEKEVQTDSAAEAKKKRDADNAAPEGVRY